VSESKKVEWPGQDINFYKLIAGMVRIKRRPWGLEVTVVGAEDTMQIDVRNEDSQEFYGRIGRAYLDSKGSFRF
jgi:hypothetical protein